MEAGIAVIDLGYSRLNAHQLPRAKMSEGLVFLENNTIAAGQAGHAIAIDAGYMVQAKNNRADGEFWGVLDASCAVFDPSPALAFVADDRQRRIGLQPEFALGRFDSKRCFQSRPKHNEL